MTPLITGHAKSSRGGGGGEELRIEPWHLDSSLQVLHLRLTDAFLAALDQISSPNTANAEYNQMSFEIEAVSSSNGIIWMVDSSGNVLKKFEFSYHEGAGEKDTLQLVRIKVK